MKHCSLFLLLWVFSLVFSACATSKPPASPGLEVSQDEVIRYRSVLTDLRRSPFASEATVDIEKADAWLQTVQGKLAVDANSSELRLYLDAVKAQLVKVKSFYARRQAQSAGETTPPAGGNPQPSKEEAP